MTGIIRKIAITAVLTIPLVLFSTGNAFAREVKSSNEKELIDNVKEVDSGWDWEPRCAGGAEWSWNDMECKGGTGHHHHHGGTKHHHHHHHHDD